VRGGGGGWVEGSLAMRTYSCAHGAQLNSGDLTPYLTFAYNCLLDRLLDEFQCIYRPVDRSTWKI
jgi:hypothetical protein